MGRAGPAHWSAERERSHAWLLRAMVWISLTLGRRAGRIVLHGIAVYFTLFAPGARRASRDFLQRALGRPARWRDVYRHVLSFATTIHDRVFLLADQGRGLQVQVEGAQALQQALGQGRGALLVGAHYGSFELLRTMGRTQGGARVAMAMRAEHARKLQATLAAINPAAEQDVIALGQMQAMLQLRDKLDQGYLVGLLADRTLEAGDGVALPFLGAPARFAQGPWRLAALLQRPVFFMAGVYLGGNRYRIHLEPIADFSGVARGARQAAIDAAMARYVQVLQTRVLDNPWNWFNFYDFWKP